MTTVIRKSVPVDETEREIARRLRMPGSPEREALLAAGVELSDTPSEAEALHALLVVGHRTLNEHMLEIGYANLAATESDEDRATRRSISARAARMVD